MKSIRTLYFALFMLMPFLATAQCQASFTYTANGLTVSFNGTGNPSSSYFYYWWFSDMGNNSYQEDPTYTFSSSGTYTVCFSIYDSLSSCNDSICMPVTVTGSSTCTANFTTIDTAGYIYFLGSSTAGSGAQYVWDFGDGNFGSGQYPWHQYANPGTYTACLTVYNANQQFCDSTCHTVVVTSGGGCNASFTAIDTAGYMYFFGSSNAPGAQYIWDFGDGNFGSGQYPWHQYANPGVYNVCLTVYDSNQVFCDSTCQTIVVQGSGGCNAYFTQADSVGYIFFFGNSTLGWGGTYIWDFGDGNFGYTQNPSHQYAVPGVYTVCLTVYDSMQVFCDSTCNTVVVTQAASIEENVMQNSLTVAPNPADDVVRISFDAATAGNATVTFFDAAGRIAKTETMNTASGKASATVNTQNMAQGIYLVKIEMNGDAAWTRLALTHQ